MPHIVKAKVVKVTIGSPTDNRVARILREGAVVPDGVDEEQLKSLTKRGFLRKVTARQAATATEQPADDTGEDAGEQGGSASDGSGA